MASRTASSAATSSPPGGARVYARRSARASESVRPAEISACTSPHAAAPDHTAPGNPRRHAARSGRRALALDPAADHVDGIRLLVRAERPALGDAVPALEARATARRGGMLGDEHRVPPVGRLAAVLGGLRGRDPPGEDLPR